MMDNHGQPCNQTVAKPYAVQRLRQQQQQQYKNQQQQQQHEHEIPLNVMENNVEFHDDGLEGSGGGHNEREFILSHNMHPLQPLNALTEGREEEDEAVTGKKIKRSEVLSYEKSLLGEINFKEIKRFLFKWFRFFLLKSTFCISLVIQFKISYIYNIIAKGTFYNLVLF